jgi:hypothetical protein
MVGTPPVETVETVKTLDLSSYFPTATVLATNKQVITIGKYLMMGDVLCVLVMTDKRYVTTYGDKDDVDLGRQYNFRGGEGSVKGELLLINRNTWEVNLISKNLVTCANQIRFSGFIDMLIDERNKSLVLAELSEDSNEIAMTYDTAKLFVEAKDRYSSTKHTPVTDDFTATTYVAWFAWLNTEVNTWGFPKFIHVKKDGTKTWTLQFPKLSITAYTMSDGVVTTGGSVPPSLIVKEKLYVDDNTLIRSKHGYTCYGGYTNCMLYQDVFDKDMPIYLGRCYDAWIQIPYPSADYTITSKLGANGNFLADSTTYMASLLPGELGGFFGVEYSKLIKPSVDMDGTLKVISDVPGDFCKGRSFLKDDPAGYWKIISAVYPSTHLTLLALNNSVVTDYITGVRMSSIFNTFSSGPGSCDIDYPSQRLSTMGFQYLWAIGLHIYPTRFAIITNKDDPEEQQILLAGSFEHQIDNFTNGDKIRSHHSQLMSSLASTGLYMAGLVKDPLTGLYPVLNAGSNWSGFAYTNNPVDPAYQQFIASHTSQWTMYVTRSDLKMLDKSTYYLVNGVLRRQFDTFVTYSSVVMAGWLWFFADRSCWRLKKDDYGKSIISGWLGDIVGYDNAISSMSRYGAETTKLQEF